VAYAPGGATVLGVGSVRLLVGGAVLVVLARRIAPPTSPAPAVPSSRRWPAVIGAVAVATYQLSFFAAVDRTGVAVGTMIAIGSGPVFAGLLDLLVRHRRPSPRWGVATAAAVLGGCLLAAVGGEVRLDALGIVCALLAGASYAAYAMAGAVLVERGTGPDRAMALLFGYAALVLLPVLLTEPTSWLWSARGLVVALWLGVGTVAVAYALFGRALAHVPVSTVTTLSLAEPVTATLLAVILLGERLAPAGWVGVALIITGLVIVGRPPRPAARRPSRRSLGSPRRSTARG